MLKPVYQTRSSHLTPIRCSAWSPDSKKLVYGDDSGWLHTIHNFPNFRTRLQPCHSERIWGVAFSKDGNVTFSASEDKSIQIRSGISLELVRERGGFGKQLTAIAIAHSTNLLAVAARNEIFVIDQNSLETNFSFGRHGTFVNEMDWESSGRYLVSATDLEGVSIFDAHRQSRLHDFIELNGYKSAQSARFETNGLEVVTCSSGGAINEYHALTRNPKNTILPRYDASKKCAYSVFGNSIVASLGQGAFGVWRRGTGDLIRRVTGLENQHSWVHSLAFSPDGRYLFVGWGSGLGQLWNANAVLEKNDE